MPAIPSCIIDPIWDQFSELLPEKKVEHPLGCHNPRIPDRVVFDKLVQVLVFGCAYERIADESCSATTLRRRRDEWIASGVMGRLQQIVLDAYDWMIGLDLSDVALDCCITRTSARSGKPSSGSRTASTTHPTFGPGRRHPTTLTTRTGPRGTPAKADLGTLLLWTDS